jgi:hypothetical protein
MRFHVLQKIKYRYFVRFLIVLNLFLRRKFLLVSVVSSLMFQSIESDKDPCRISTKPEARIASLRPW